MPPSEDKSYIEELKKSLYSRTAPPVRTKRKLRFTDPGAHVPTDWEHPPDEDVRPTELNQEYKDNRMSFFTKLLIGSVIFCIAAVGLGAYLFFNGANLISANNIDIRIAGPVSIPGGVPESFDVAVTNKNSVDLQLVDMTVNFPVGTTDPSNPGQPLTSYTRMIGDLSSGGSAHQTLQATIFGEENLQKEIVVTLTYSVKGSSAVFTKTQSYDVLINSSPLNVTVSSFKEITSGQVFDMTVDIKSNSEDTLRSVLLKADYPFGYSLVSSSLPSLSDNATWKIGDIPPGGERKLVLHGKLNGEDTDVRAFHFTVGAQSTSNPKTIGTQYMAVEQDMTIQKPFITMNVSIDSDTAAGDHVGSFGQAEHVTINWANNLPDTVSNVVIDAKLSGSAYDKTQVLPDAGVFNSGTGDIVWNQQTNPNLGSVAAGANGTVSFTIIPKDAGTAAHPLVNPGITITANVSGNRTQESNVPQNLTAAVTKNIKIASTVALSGRIARSVGPFSNTGPIPPRAEQATTYTIIWDADNTANAASNAVVTASLPAYVKWLNAISPAGEDISYDPNSGIITWNVGSVNTYTLSSSNRREVMFQISFTPSVTQVGTSPTLINAATLTATDNFTGSGLKSVQDLLTTRFSTDPAYQPGNETVSK